MRPLIFAMVLATASVASAQNWGGESAPGVVEVTVTADVVPVASDSLKASAKVLQGRPGFTW